jgi:hypothetical protein
MGRDYLRVGLFMEMFREKGVRLIAVNDGIDTNCGEDDFTPFRAILAEWYARDTSKKIRSVFKTRTEAGYHCSGSVPYGYLRDPNDKQQWIVDEEAAKVIRRIFNLVIEGNGVYEIANILSADKVLIPTAHFEEIGADDMIRLGYSDPYKWRGSVVSTILARRDYMGIKVLRKTYSESYKSKRRQDTPEEERIEFKGAIPQIVDEETWHNAQRLRRTVRRPAKDGRPPSPLTGLLICADCGKKLTHARNFDYDKNRPRDEYICGNYRQGTKNCTMHYVRTVAIEKVILKSIKYTAQYVLSNESEFIEKVRQASNLRQEAEVKESKRRLNKAARRSRELDTLVKKLYETYALGKLPETHYDRMLAEYDTEQAALRQELAELQAQVDNYTADSIRADSFIELVHRHTEFDVLTPVLLNEFIDKVIIHEGDKSSGKRTQKIEVHMNFIGNIDIPIPDKTPEEIEAELKAKKKPSRAKYLREWRARKKLEAAQATV